MCLSDTHVTGHLKCLKRITTYTASQSSEKTLSNGGVGTGVKVELVGNACFHHVLFRLLMFFMATGAYGHFGKAHIGAIII